MASIHYYLESIQAAGFNIRIVDAGLSLNASTGRIGLATRLPAQLGQTSRYPYNFRILPSLEIGITH